MSEQVTAAELSARHIGQSCSITSADGSKTVSGLSLREVSHQGGDRVRLSVIVWGDAIADLDVRHDAQVEVRRHEG